VVVEELEELERCRQTINSPLELKVSLAAHTRAGLQGRLVYLFNVRSFSTFGDIYRIVNKLSVN